MEREMFFAFAKLCKEFAHSFSANDCVFQRVGRGEQLVGPIQKTTDEQIHSLAGVCTVIDFDAYKLHIYYDAYLTGYIPPSIVSMRVSFNDDSFGLEFLTYELLPYFEKELCEFGCTLFSRIESPEKMSNCFKCLENFYRKYETVIREIAESTERLQSLTQAFKRRLAEMFGSRIFTDINSVEFSGLITMFRAFEMARYTTGAYSKFLDGKYKSAVKQLVKYKYKSRYEYKLLEFIRALPDGEKYNAYAVYGDGNSNAQMYRGVQISDAQELIIFFAGAVLAFPIALAFYILLYLLFAFVVSSGTLYYSGLESYNVAFSSLPAMITSIAASFYLRRVVLRLFFGRKRKAFLQYDKISVTRTTRKVMKVLLNIVLVLSLVFTVLMANTGIVITDDGVVDKSSLFDLRGVIYEWRDIDSVWLVSGRTNSYDEWLDNPSYVLLLKNGEKLDFYECAELEDVKKKAESIFTEHIGEIQSCKSADDIKFVSKSNN